MTGCQNAGSIKEPVIETIKDEALLDSLDHDCNNTIVPAIAEETDVMSPMHKDYDEWMKKKQGEGDGEDQVDKPKDIPALGPSTLEEVPLGPKGSRLKIEFDEEKAKSGYQDLKNAGKFWRAACLLGTRKDDLCSTLNPQPPFRLYPDLTLQSVSYHRTRLE